MSRITLTEVGDAVKQGKFFYVPIAYIDKGKPFTKKVMDFANKEVYAVMKAAKAGEEYDVEVEKDNNGYWQWKTVAKATGAGAASSVSSATVRSTYETPEERARRQVLIVRQSCLAQAIIVKGAGEQNPDNITELAEKFEEWVNRD